MPILIQWLCLGRWNAPGLLDGSVLDRWPGKGDIPSPRTRMGFSSLNHMDWGGSPEEIAGREHLGKERLDMQSKRCRLLGFQVPSFSEDLKIL